MARSAPGRCGRRCTARPATTPLPFLREIGWRDFAAGLVDQFPDVAEVPGRAVFARFPHRDAPEDLCAWQRGRTGYPIGCRHAPAVGDRVDAQSRSHDRGVFLLIKDLLIDWRTGGRWFWDTLVDADLGNNSLGWQWIMGSGVDSSPFNRIFAPVGQSEKFDAEGRYIRRWVPELAKLPDTAIHAPWAADADVLKAAGVRLGDTYPKPVVNHAAARARALAAYASLKEI